MFNKNLKYYRLKKNMSKKDLAEACGVTPMAITNYEQGSRRPEIDIISKMAKVLGVGVADFIRSRNDTLAFVHGEFRKNTALTKSQQEYVKESIEEYFGRFFDAVDYLGGQTLPSQPSIHCLKSTGDYEEDAVLLRRRLGIPEIGSIGDLTAILENQGILVFVLDFDNRHFFGINGTVDGYPYIVVNKNMTPERTRSTIAHELAHMMFNLDSNVDEEEFATKVSGAFLITKNDVIREVGIHRRAITKDLIATCKEYGISMLLLVKRLSQANVISSSVEKDFYIRAGKAGWRINEPSWADKREKPLLFEQLVFRAINEEDISIQKGVELLQIPYADVEKECGLLLEV